MRNIKKTFAAIFSFAICSILISSIFLPVSAREKEEHKIILNGMMQEDFFLDIEVDIFSESDPAFTYQTTLTQENDFHEEVSLPKGTYSITCYDRIRDTEYKEDIWVVSNYDGVSIDIRKEDQQVNILCGDYEFLMAYDGVIYNPGALGGYVTEESVQEETQKLISEQVYEEITEENFEEITGAGEKEDPVVFPTAEEPESGKYSVYIIIGTLAAAAIISGGIVFFTRRRAGKREDGDDNEE